MKNVLRLVALSLVLLVMLGALVSCGGPNADPEKAEKALKDNDYDVEVIDSKIALALLGLSDDVDNIECVIMASSEEDRDDGIFIFYFEEKEDADNAFESLEEYAEKAMEDNDDIVIKKSGKMVYFGTKAAVKAAK